MVLCKFFQQGYCRFGQNCKFEHAYASKYSYRANTATQPQQQTQSQSQNISDEQLAAKVMADIQSALKGNQWVISSYSPFTDKPGFPGLMDLSPEEARLFMYEAKANNTLDQAITYFNSITTEARSKYEKLARPTPDILNVLRALYNGEIAQSPFTSGSSFGNTNADAGSLFRSAAQGTSVFGQNNSSPSVFGQANSPSSVFAAQTTPSVFGSPNNATQPQSVFAQANQSVFGNQKQETPSVFASPTQANPGSIFANASQSIFGTNQSPNQQSPFSNANSNVFQQQSSPSVFNQSNVFGVTQGMQSANVFAQNNAVTSSSPFAQNNASPFAQNSSPFGQSGPSSVFGQTSGSVFGQQTAMDESGIYSKMEDLSEEDIEIYQNGEFKLGFVPMLPPPKSLCI